MTNGIRSIGLQRLGKSGKTEISSAGMLKTPTDSNVELVMKVRNGYQVSLKASITQPESLISE